MEWNSSWEANNCEVVTKLAEFYGKRCVIAMCTRARHWFQCYEPSYAYVSPHQVVAMCISLPVTNVAGPTHPNFLDSIYLFCDIGFEDLTAVVM
jgi:hypothetical protein